MPTRMIILVVLLLSGFSSAVTLVSISTGLEIPLKEAGHTELEITDINADGHLDIISVGDHGSPWVNSDEHGIMVWLGDGEGNWTVYQSGEFGYGGCAVGDLDLDGHMDVAWGIHHDWGSGGFGERLIGAALGDGSGQSWIPWDTGLATYGESWGMFATDLADFDLDGDLDIVCESFGSGNGVRVYENHMDGTWTQEWLIDSGNASYTIEAGDFNADGLPDFVCTRWNTHVYFGDGNFGFAINQNGIPDKAMSSVDCGDFNGDGQDDIVCSMGSDSGVHCYSFNNGSGEWSDHSTGLPSGGVYVDGVQFGYIDGDDNMDLVLYDDPIGHVYLGNGAGIWTADASWTMPGSGDASALRIDGDVDHDGREDIAVQGEMVVGMFERNQLRVYSPWLEPLALGNRVISPDGGETLMSSSISEIRWLTAVPPPQGQATVDLYLSTTGAGGPWTLIVADIPDNGRFQWTVPSANSSTCRIRAVAETSSESVEDISDDDFTIIGAPGTGEFCSPVPPVTELFTVAPNPSNNPVTVRIVSAGTSPIRIYVFDINGRSVDEVSTGSFSAGCNDVLLDGLAPGIYFCRMISGDVSATQRFVVVE